MDANKLYTCDNRDPALEPTEGGHFFPVQVGNLNAVNNQITYTSGICFKSITFTYQQTGALDSEDIGDVILTVDTEQAESLLCKDWFFFASTELYHVETFFLSGKHQIKFTNIQPDGMADIRRNGLKVYMFCDGYVDTFLSVFHFALQFLGGIGTNPWLPIIGSHVPEYMVQANIQFLKDTMNYTLEKRDITDYDYDESNI